MKSGDFQGLVPASYIITFDSIFICQAIYSYKSKSARQLSFEKVSKKSNVKIEA